MNSRWTRNEMTAADPMRTYRNMVVVAVALLALAVSGCGASASLPAPVSTIEPTPIGSASSIAPPKTIETMAPVAPVALTGIIDYRVVNEFPHDVQAFTQGLEVVGDRLLESTGLTGASERREVELESGEVINRQPLDQALFGEGITERNGLLYQLTYRANLLIISDAETLAPTGETFSYDGEGWGLCTTDAIPGQPFVMSNGSSTLTIRDPETFAITETIEVMDANGSPVENLNELECIGDQVLANVFQSDFIVAIDLASGVVQGVLDLEELGPEQVEPGQAVLNGIAYRPRTGTYLVTGKLWPSLYELELSPS